MKSDRNTPERNNGRDFRLTDRYLIRGEETDDRPGIRTGVWLAVFGLLLLCAFVVSVPRRDTIQSVGVIASSSVEADPQRASPLSGATVQRTDHEGFVSETSETKSRHDDEELQMVIIEQMTQDRRNWVEGLW